MASPSSNEFGWNLLSLLSKEQDKNNLFMSPFSLSVTLAMTRIGAEGETADGMEKALCWKADGDVIHKEFQEYLEFLREPNDCYTLKTANRIYIEEGYSILESCSQQTKDFYLAEPVSAQFAKNAKGETTKINSWVEKQTEKKIKDLIPPDFIVPDTKMVLVNAVYFKGIWMQKFSKASVSLPFHLTRSKVKFVPTMNLKYSFPYHKAHDHALLELPYKGDRFSMVILLPDETNGLKDLEKRLTIAEIQESISKLKLSSKVDLRLPKFEICSSFELRDPLTELGMGSAFSPCDADFSGVTGSRNLFISECVHKAYLKVDEEGSRAAAATGCGRVKQSARIDTEIQFHVDHPFLTLIQDKTSNMILFFGRVTNPSDLS